MTPLRKRMIEDMQLRGLSSGTQEVYARAVYKLAEYYKQSPAQISDEELRAYFLYLKNENTILSYAGTKTISANLFRLFGVFAANVL